MPYLISLSEFRNDVREQARTLKATEILKLCDQLRDEVLPNLGVRLEDREGGGPSAVKLVDRETLLREREAKKQLEADKAAEKERKRLEVAAAAAAKEAQKKINPLDMFKAETDKYSAFDDKVRTQNILRFESD
jgi:cysteinyl-tRNA synthetase